jgi:hypothetical protein
MCVIAVIKVSETIPSFSTLKKAWDTNPDGAGFMYPDGEKLVVVKGLMSFNAFKGAFKEHAPKFSVRTADKTPPVAIVDVCVHFRIKSHGAITPEMTHPHVVKQGELAIAHNGIICGLKSDDVKSDTVIFIDTILRKLPPMWYRNEVINSLLEDRVGRGNKIVIFNQAGLVRILNEGSGVWVDGVWWSNQHHVRVSSVFSSYGNSGLGYFDHAYTWPTDKEERRDKKPVSAKNRLPKPSESKLTLMSAALDPNDDEMLELELQQGGEDLVMTVTLGQAQALQKQIMEGKIDCWCMPTCGSTFGQVIHTLRKQIEKKDKEKANAR